MYRNTFPCSINTNSLSCTKHVISHISNIYRFQIMLRMFTTGGARTSWLTNQIHKQFSTLFKSVKKHNSSLFILLAGFHHSVCISFLLGILYWFWLPYNCVLFNHYLISQLRKSYKKTKRRKQILSLTLAVFHLLFEWCPSF